jgi:hypothetical protein
MSNFPKKNMSTPVLGHEQTTKGWSWPDPRYQWNPGTPRPFTSQHNFGDTGKVNATESARDVSTKKKGG